jgi:hypothetical protein
MPQAQLFPDRGCVNLEGRVDIGNGYAVEWLARQLLAVYRYGVLYKTAEMRAAIDRRRLVVELVLECGVTKLRLANALNISRQSIDNWVDSFKKAGFEGLVNSYKGGIPASRAENADTLPRGNKARQLEQARREEREKRQEQQLLIGFGASESGDEIERTEVFDASHGFEESRYAGSFLYWGIFQHFFGLMELVESYLGRQALVVYLFAMMSVQGIGSVEQLKTVYRREFGRILGIKQLFSKPVLWLLIHGACAANVSKQLIESFFQRQAQRSLVALYWLYIDGHFIPYYGKERIHPGYYTQRDQMMPGQTKMFVHDGQGQVVYFELQEGKGDLKEMIRRMSEKWAAHLGGIPPLIVSDRESWGVEHFLSMAGYRFVTWEKFSKPEELAAIPDDRFGPVFVVNGKEYQATEENKTYQDQAGHRVELRRVILWNKSTDHRVACVAQDELEDTIGIARAMLGRWGCSENALKHMGERCHMHYNPVFDPSEPSEKQDIVNPERKERERNLREIKKKIAKVERALGRLPCTTNKDGSLRKSKRRERFQKQLAELKEELAVALEALENCPERIELGAACPGKTFRKLSDEGKNLWDLAETLVWNARKKLTEILKEFLPDPRDLLPVLEAITTCRGWIRSTPEAVEVRLEPLETPRFHAAQIQLCKQLNEKLIRLHNGKRLLYDVGPKPRSVQEATL